MNGQDVMLVMDQMSQIFETLVKRIEETERKLDDARCCSCQTWKEQRNEQCNEQEKAE